MPLSICLLVPVTERHVGQPGSRRVVDGHTLSAVPQAAVIIAEEPDPGGIVTLTDSVFLLNFLFLAGATPPCTDAADANDDGNVVLTDAIFLLNHLFQGGPVIPEPFPEAGEDPTPDEIGCR